MKAGKNRLWRKENPLRELAIGDRRGRAAPLLAVLAAACMAGPAQAAMGGASTTAYGGAPPVGQDIAFSSVRSAGATWYGPGLYGRKTACGQVLRPGTIGVAHRSLPCGTTVKFTYRGRYLITQVIDRGPYTKGNSWDLTNGAREVLGFEGSDRLQYSLAINFARH
ncbi:MAG TPA: septal ring lytic transglycosylase RlpA family protein [Solirubrobacterales bacterium]|nr:septal ring lytic transglycosylase RlpA family protein [Solirubrobacterales bacterium]